MTSNAKYIAEMMSQVDDLEAVPNALARETVIRSVMAETGESREIVTETLDASISMGQEAVLGLMECEPTTLYEALERYVEELNKTDPDSVDAALMAKGIAGELAILMVYPYPGLPGVDTLQSGR